MILGIFFVSSMTPLAALLPPDLPVNYDIIALCVARLTPGVDTRGRGTRLPQNFIFLPSFLRRQVIHNFPHHESEYSYVSYFTSDCFGFCIVRIGETLAQRSNSANGDAASLAKDVITFRQPTNFFSGHQFLSGSCVMYETTHH